MLIVGELAVLALRRVGLAPEVADIFEVAVLYGYRLQPCGGSGRSGMTIEYPRHVHPTIQRAVVAREMAAHVLEEAGLDVTRERLGELLGQWVRMRLLQPGIKQLATSQGYRRMHSAAS
jgi:hypothetical protein